jgi:hypothetical protein
MLLCCGHNSRSRGSYHCHQGVWKRQLGCSRGLHRRWLHRRCITHPAKCRRVCRVAIVEPRCRAGLSENPRAVWDRQQRICDRERGSGELDAAAIRFWAARARTSRSSRSRTCTSSRPACTASRLRSKAGRAWNGNAVYRDLIRISLLLDAHYIAVAVRRRLASRILMKP